MSGNDWKSGRAWVGHIAILLLAAVECWIIYNGYLPHIICGPKSDADCVPMDGWGWPPSILLPVIGIMTFFGTLFITNILSKKKDISNWEMRKAITASILIVYFFFLPLMLFASTSPIYRIDTSDDPAETEASTEPAVTPTPQAGSGLYAVNLQDVTATAIPSEGTPSPEAAPAESTPESTVEANADTSPGSSEITTPIGLAASITTAFTTLVGTVIGFYFLSKTVEGVAYLKFGKKEEEEER